MVLGKKEYMCAFTDDRGTRVLMLCLQVVALAMVGFKNGVDGKQTKPYIFL